MKKMTDDEREFLKAKLGALKNAMADTSNRIKIMQAKRKDFNQEYKGIRARLVRDELEQVADW